MARLLAARADLPAAEARVADALLDARQPGRYENVGELAERAGSSPATVVRLCKRLGFDGFLGMKLALAEEAGAARQFGHPDVEPGEGAQDVLETAVLADARALSGALAALDRGRFGEAVAAISACDQLMLGGVGTSAALAELAALRFMALGVRATALGDVISQHMAAALLSSDSVALLISHTGSSTDTVEFAATARAQGAMTVGLTSFARSPLAAAVDIPLVTGNARNPDALALFANRVVHASVLGALHGAVAVQFPSRPTKRQPGAVLAKHQF